jgi:hypothetical protein
LLLEATVTEGVHFLRKIQKLKDRLKSIFDGMARSLRMMSPAHRTFNRSTKSRFLKTMTTPRKFTFSRGRPYPITLSVVCIILSLLLLLSGRAVAQEFRGTISGTVTDATGAVVKDAQ